MEMNAERTKLLQLITSDILRNRKPHEHENKSIHIQNVCKINTYIKLSHERRMEQMLITLKLETLAKKKLTDNIGSSEIEKQREDEEVMKKEKRNQKNYVSRMKINRIWKPFM